MPYFRHVCAWSTQRRLFWGLTAHGLFILQCSNYLLLDEVKKSLAKELPVSLAKNIEFLRRLPKLNGIDGFTAYGRNLKRGPRSPLIETMRIRAAIRAHLRMFSFVPADHQRAAARWSSFCTAAVRPPLATISAPAGRRWRNITALRLLMPEQQPSNNAQRLLQLVQSGRYRARQRRSLFDPADDRADGARSRHRSSDEYSSPGFPPAAP